MSGIIELVAAGTRKAGELAGADSGRRNVRFESTNQIEGLATHSFPGRRKAGAPAGKDEDSCPFDRLGVNPVTRMSTKMGSCAPDESDVAASHDDLYEEQRIRRKYRGRTITMLRRYMRYSIETGRLPSLLGREFFRAKVTAYRLVTFEDRVIFVHDMETSLNKLDEFSRDIIARHILQEYDQAETARLLSCSERTIRTYATLALDLLSEILLEVGLLERIESRRGKSCQGGNNGPFSVSDCEDNENNS